MKHPERPDQQGSIQHEGHDKHHEMKHEPCDHAMGAPKPEMFGRCPTPPFGGHMMKPKMEHGHLPPFWTPFPQMGFMHHEFDFYLSLTDELSLTEDQIKKLQDIRIKTEKNRIMIRARIKVAEIELQELLSQTPIDIAKIDAKVREIGEIKIEDSINDVHALIEATEVLTHEQKERLKKLRPFVCPFK